MELELKVLVKEARQMRWENFMLIPSSERPFEWLGVWKKNVLVRASLKRNFSVMSASDVYIDYIKLRKDGLTMWEDKKEIALRINRLLHSEIISSKIVQPNLPDSLPVL